MLFGAMEAGGTKFLCAVGTGPDDLREVARIPTTTPVETLGRALAFFERFRGRLRALGIGSFGPLDLDPASPAFGTVTTTPKPGWSGVPLLRIFQEALGIPVALDTDVNAAALGEGRWGAAQGLHTFVYITVGTGIGGGAVIHGRRLHGLLHPEMGHLCIPRDRERDPFPGVCPYHGDCWEGLASGPAMAARWGQPPEAWPPDHPGWALEAEYVALGLVNLILALAPQRVILGGGVFRFPPLYGMVRRRVQERLGGYLRAPALAGDLEGYIVPPALGERSGLLGALALAMAAAEDP